MLGRCPSIRREVKVLVKDKVKYQVKVFASCGHSGNAAQMGFAGAIATPEHNLPKGREPGGHLASSVQVNSKRWRQFKGEWVQLSGDAGAATVRAGYSGKQEPRSQGWCCQRGVSHVAYRWFVAFSAR